MDPIAWLGTATGLAAMGGTAIFIGWGGLGVAKKWTAKSKRGLMLIGAVLIALALSEAGYFAFGVEEAAPATTVGSFDVTGSESSTWLTVDNNAQSFTWAVTYNYTAGDFTNNVGVGVATNTEYGEFTFQVDRGLGTVGLVQTYGDVMTIPSISNDTDGESYPVLTKTNDLYNAIWTRADATTAYDMITLTIAEDADGVSATLNMTLSASAIHSMDQYDSFNISVYVGGETWTIQVLLATVY